MTIDEAIQRKKNLIAEWKKELDMTPDNDLTHISDCKMMIYRYSQEIEWLEELKQLRKLQQLTEIDLEIPQHFTKKQSEWIKAYCIQKNKEFYNKAIDDLAEKLINYVYEEDFMSDDVIREIAEQLKVGDSNK